MRLFVENPFSPSGVTKLVRRHRAVGYEVEVQEVVSIAKRISSGSDNALVVLVGEYGWGKTELLDELEERAREEGIDVVRLTLAMPMADVIEEVAKVKVKGRSLLLLVDEADEVTRMVTMYKLGALSYEEFRECLTKFATSVRALLEPRNYKSLVKEPQKMDRVLIVLAVTPQLYYTILKNLIPDVFDVVSGRVYKELKVREEFPLWLFERMVIDRLESYSTEERRELARRDRLYPFRFEHLSAVYCSMVRRKERPSPRSLVKTMSDLLERVERGARRLSDLADLLEVELNLRGIPLSETEEEVLKSVLISGIPRTEESIAEELGVSKGEARRLLEGLVRKGLLDRVGLAVFEFEDKEALAWANKVRGEAGLSYIPPEDPYKVSMEPYSYYTRYSEKLNNPLVFAVVPEASTTELTAYVPSRRLLELALLERSEDRRNLVREILEGLNDLSNLHKELENMIPLPKQHIGRTFSYSNIGGIRHAFLTLEANNDVELENISKLLYGLVSSGEIYGIPIDVAVVVVVSRVFLSEQLEKMFGALLNARWKSVYREAAKDFVMVVNYGAERVDRLKLGIAHLKLGLETKYADEVKELVDRILAFLENAKLRLFKYTLSIRRKKGEGKDEAIRSIVRAWAEGISVDLPEVFRDEAGAAKVSLVEETLYEYLTKVGSPLTQREFEALVRRLYPVQLWRDFREQDLLNLMSLRGLILRDDVVVPITEATRNKLLERIRARIEELRKRAVAERVVEVNGVRTKMVARLEASQLGRLEEALKDVERVNDLKLIARINLGLRELEGRHQEEIAELNKEVARVGKEVEHALRRIVQCVEICRRLAPHRLANLSKLIPPEEMSVEDAVRWLIQVRSNEHELATISKVEDVLNSAKEVDYLLKERNVDVLADLSAILSVDDPTGLLEKYRRVLDKVSLMVKAEEESRRKKREEEERIKSWLRERLGVEDFGKASRKLAGLGVEERVVLAVAKRGLGSEFEAKDLAEELKLGRDEVEAQLESLYKAGIIGKKYVA